MDLRIPLILINTFMAASAGLISSSIMGIIVMKKPKKDKRKCGMYYYTYIPWCFKNDCTDKLDKEDIDWYYNEYLKSL